MVVLRGYRPLLDAESETLAKLKWDIDNQTIMALNPERAIEIDKDSQSEGENVVHYHTQRGRAGV